MREQSFSGFFKLTVGIMVVCVIAGITMLSIAGWAIVSIVNHITG